MENIGFDAAEKGWQLRGSVSPDTCPGSRRFLFEKSLQRIVPRFADAWKGAETVKVFFVQTYEGVCDRKTLCHNPRKKESVRRNEL